MNFESLLYAIALLALTFIASLLDCCHEGDERAGKAPTTEQFPERALKAVDPTLVGPF